MMLAWLHAVGRTVAENNGDCGAVAEVIKRSQLIMRRRVAVSSPDRNLRQSMILPEVLGHRSVRVVTRASWRVVC